MTHQLVEDIQISLHDKLNRQSITRTEVTEGIKDCFAICQYDFLSRRQPDISPDEVKAVCKDIVETVFHEEGLTPENATPKMLQHVTGLLDQRFEFMQDPQLRAHHQHVLEELIQRMEE